MKKQGIWRHRSISGKNTTLPRKPLLKGSLESPSRKAQKPRSAELRLTGNNALSTTEIEKQILSRPGGFFQPGVLVQETLDEDVQAIAELYFSKGFRTAEITPVVSLTPDRTQADIQINVHEGTQTIVSEITITGLHAISEQVAFDAFSLKTGSLFFEDTLENDKNKLTELISETGHPHVQIQVRGDFPG